LGVAAGGNVYIALAKAVEGWSVGLAEGAVAISPWEFKLEYRDYKEVIRQFGVQEMTRDLVARMKEKNRLFERGLIFAHRGFERILEAEEKGEEYVILTGMMPSGRFHFGHKLIADLMAWYYRRGVKVVIPISDIEAYVIRGVSQSDVERYAVEEYMLNYMALGVDLANRERVMIYSQWANEEVKNLAIKFSAKVTASHLGAMFGFRYKGEGEESDTIGRIFFPFIDAADIMYPQSEEMGGPKPVLVPVGIDQDPYIRLCHDLAPKFSMLKPSSIYVKMMAGLQGPGTKMSSSKPETAIFLSDSPDEARRKLMEAFTGGRATAREQREEGGQPDICVPYMFLLFHFEDDILKRTFEDCTSGSVLCGECKQRIAERLVRFLEEHRRKLKEARERLPRVFEVQEKLGFKPSWL